MSQDPVSTSREPAPANYRRIRIGDVGFIQRGKFYLLFSAGRPLGKRQPGKDVPITFKELTVGRTTFSQPRPAGCIQTFREFGVGPGVRSSISPCVLSTRRFFAYLKSAPSRSPKSGVHPLLKLTGNHGAALMTRYPTYREDCLLASAFKEYTVRHYGSWVAFALQKGCAKDIQPVLVSGLDMTRDFALVAYSNTGGYPESDPTLAILIPTPSSASAWGTWCTSRPCDTNCGPRQCDLPSDKQVTDLPLANPGSIPNGFNQCIFIRYCTLRPRTRLPRFPKVNMEHMEHLLASLRECTSNTQDTLARLRLRPMVDDIIPNPKPHPVATAVLNADIEVERRVEGPDDTEPPALGPMVVRRCLVSAPSHSLATSTI